MGLFRNLLYARLCVDSLRKCGRQVISYAGYSTDYQSRSTEEPPLTEKLQANKISFKEGHTSYHVECKFCGSDEKSSETKCYINKTTGYFICPHCDISLKSKDVWKAYESGNLLKPKEQSYKSKFANQTTVPESVLPLLGIKNLKQSHLHSIEAKFVPELNIISFPLRNSVKKIVGEKVFQLVEKTESTYQVSFSGLLVSNTKYKKAILVNNILDYVTLCIERDLEYAVICLPYAFKKIPQECLPSLELFDELVLWFKYDVSGWDNMKSFSSKLGERRCSLIRPTESTPAPYEAQTRGLSCNEILQTATPVCHKFITTFSSLKHEIFSDLQNIEKVRGVKWTRFPVLNSILKGHRRGELTIISGPTGSGKTTFTSEYSLDLAAQGVSTLWGSFEMKNSRLGLTLLHQFVGYSLEEKLNEFHYWASEFEKIPIYFMTFHGQQSLKIILEAVESAIYLYDISHLIIDNLQFMMGIQKSRTDKYYEQDTIVTAFRSLASTKNIHISLIIHPRKEKPEDDLTASSIFGSAKATQEADNILIIQNKQGALMKCTKYLQVVKNRYSGDLGTMPLNFHKDSLSFSHHNRRE